MKPLICKVTLLLQGTLNYRVASRYDIDVVNPYKYHHFEWEID